MEEVKDEVDEWERQELVESAQFRLGVKMGYRQGFADGVAAAKREMAESEKGMGGKGRDGEGMEKGKGEKGPEKSKDEKGPEKGKGEGEKGMTRGSRGGKHVQRKRKAPAMA